MPASARTNVPNKPITRMFASQAFGAEPGRLFGPFGRWTRCERSGVDHSHSGLLAECGRGRISRKCVPFCPVLSELWDTWPGNRTPSVSRPLSEAGHQGRDETPASRWIRRMCGSSELDLSAGGCWSRAQKSTDVLVGTRARGGSKCSDSVRGIPGPWIPGFAGMTERCGGFSRDPLNPEQLLGGTGEYLFRVEGRHDPVSQSSTGA